MSDLKFFSKHVPVKDKRVIVRLDLNVPITNSKIEDYTRIKVIEPFINQLIEDKAKVILLTHLGRPKGKFDLGLSLRPVFKYLENMLKGKLFFYKENIDSRAIDASNKLNPGSSIIRKYSFF